MYQKIVIGTSPRTGSTLLIRSLARHPFAINAEEYLNTDINKNPITLENYNLFKVFEEQKTHPLFDQVLKNAYLIYLTRQDTEAQQRSFTLANKTGIWQHGQSKGYINDNPASIDELNKRAKEMFQPICHQELSYEYMISNWDKAILSILHGAGWTKQRLPMAVKKMSYGNTHKNDIN